MKLKRGDVKEETKMGRGDYSKDFESIKELVKENHCSPNCPYIDLYYDEMDQDEYGKRVVEVSCDEFKALHNPYIEADKIKLCPILYFIYHEETTPEPPEDEDISKK